VATNFAIVVKNFAKMQNNFARNAKFVKRFCKKCKICKKILQKVQNNFARNAKKFCINFLVQKNFASCTPWGGPLCALLLPCCPEACWKNGQFTLGEP
jgi:hypothetical protein